MNERMTEPEKEGIDELHNTKWCEVMKWYRTHTHDIHAKFLPQKGKLLKSSFPKGLKNQSKSKHIVLITTDIQRTKKHLHSYPIALILNFNISLKWVVEIFRIFSDFGVTRQKNRNFISQHFPCNSYTFYWEKNVNVALRLTSNFA